MSNVHLEVTRRKLRFITSIGMLTPEQIWDVKKPVIERAIRDLNSQLKNIEEDDDSLSFLSGKTKKETLEQENLRISFEFLKDVYITRTKEEQATLEAKEIKEHNEKIMAKIMAGRDRALDNKSEEELLAMLK